MPEALKRLCLQVQSNASVAAASIGDAGLAVPAAAAVAPAAAVAQDLPAVPAADSGNGTGIVQTIVQPQSPVVYVGADGSVVYVGPTSPSSSTYLGSKQSSTEQWLWPTIAILGLAAIVGSIAWAYSKRRHQRYMDLKTTEMVMQQRQAASTV